MKTLQDTIRHGRLAALLPLVLAAALIGGCSEDTVAPKDEAPPLTSAEVAGQAGLVAMAVSVVGPQLVDFGFPVQKDDKDTYTYTFPAGGDVQGSVNLAFYAGGAGGTPVAWNAADYATMETAPGEFLNVSLGAGGLALLSFDVSAALDRPNDQATVGGGGFFASGPYSGAFTFEGVVVGSAGTYPGSGTMTYTGGGFTMTVTFDGDNTATITMPGGVVYVVNLDTGDVTTPG